MSPSISSIELPERFRVSGHVADGGMASVWAAEDRTLGRTVAIKLLAHRFLGDHDAVRRFQREARAAASLSSHPHVVTIFDVGEHEGQPFIVMEYMSGGSLSDMLRTGRRPSRPDILRWLAEAGSALDAAHERGIVHRDVKPGNLLLDERGRLGVTDFGIARVAYDTSVTRTGEVMGTAAYLSPEQAAGESGSEASDRYALAVVAYELLCGERPFTATNFAAQARQHLESRPPPPSQRAREPLPPAVDSVLLRGLEKDPAARWPSAGALVEALTEAAGGEPPTQATVPLSGTEATQAMPTRRAAGAPPPASPPPFPPRRPLEPRPQPPRSRAPEAVPPWPVAGGARRGRPRWLVPALVAAAALLAVLVLVALPDDGVQERAGTQPRGQPTTSDPEPAADPGPTRSAPAPAPRSEPDLATASRLNGEGHRLIQAGSYAAAVDPLRRAVAACGDSEQVDPCAFALFNLGQALNRSGRPQEAIPILERRLQIPNQQATVQAELDAARRAAGQSGSSGADGGSGDDGGKEQGKRKGKKGED